MVPLLERDRGYLARNGFEVADQQGHASQGPLTDKTLAQFKSGRLQIRQLPGPRNARGPINLLSRTQRMCIRTIRPSRTFSRALAAASAMVASA
jgi:murein L,D-transpeptidase YcbB/YkuD